MYSSFTSSLDFWMPEVHKLFPNLPELCAHDSTENRFPDIPKLDPNKLVPALNPILVTDGAGLDKVTEYLAGVDSYVFDYETNCVERFYDRRARVLGIGDRNVQYIIDLLAIAGDTERLIRGQGHYRKNNIMRQEDIDILAPLVSVVSPSLQSNSHRKIGHFLEFEYVVSKWCLGVRPWNFFCTFRAERSITNGAVPVHQKDFWGLDDLVRRYCKFQIDKDSQTSFDLETPLTLEQIIYVALDLRLPSVLKPAQESKIVKDNLSWSVKIDMDAIPAFGDMHLNGMLVDHDRWKKIIEDNERDLTLSISEMDSYFIPVVGRKVKWDQDEIDRLEAIYKSYSEKSPEEVRISEEIRAARKDPERKIALLEMRSAHEQLRKEAKEKAKLAYYAERAKGNAKAKQDYAKMEGEAAINYNAPHQLLAALHKGPWGLNAKNLKSSDDTSLEKHAKLPVIQAIRKYRSLTKALGTYGYRWILTRNEIDPKTGKPGFVDPDTGRIHGKFSQGGADTGRPACTDPNLLNLPKEDRYREAFVADDGKDLVCKDCAGQELRILTEYSKEPVWVDAFNQKKDVHSISTEQIDGELWRSTALHQETIVVDGDKVKTLPKCAYYYDGQKKCSCPKHKEVRDIFKAFNFGVVYDKSAYSFSLELGKPKDVMESMLTRWKARFSITQKTLEKLRDQAYEKSEARTLSGRRRIMRAVTWEQAKNSAQAKYGERTDHGLIMKTMQGLVAAVKREGGNMPIQGTGADMMLLAMGCGFDPNNKEYLWHILEPKYDAKLLNYVYDEFVVESPEENSKEVDFVVGDAIIRAGGEFVKVVPMESEGKVSKRWQK